MATLASHGLRLLCFATLTTVACVDARIPPNGYDVLPDTASVYDGGNGSDDSIDPDVVDPVDAPSIVDVPSAVCRPNNDGTITSDEIPVVVGATETFAVNMDGTTVTPVNTAGMTTATGIVWDFTAARAEDHRVLDEVIRPAGQWWAAQYPTATYAQSIDLADTLLGIYRVSDQRVELLATVSREANRTNLPMSPPVIVVQYPLTEGATWTQSVTATGILNYVASNTVTQYTFTVDAHGEVWTPAGRYPSLRLRLDLDQTIPLTVFRRTQRTYTFLSECWGYVARIASADNETSVDFTTASEYRRLSL